MYMDLTLFGGPVRARYGRTIHLGRRRAGITVEIVVMVMVMIVTIVVMMMSDMFVMMHMNKAGE